MLSYSQLSDGAEVGKQPQGEGLDGRVVREVPGY